MFTSPAFGYVYDFNRINLGLFCLHLDYVVPSELTTFPDEEWIVDHNDGTCLLSCEYHAVM